MRKSIIAFMLLLMVGCNKNPHPIKINDVEYATINGRKILNKSTEDFVDKWNNTNKNYGYKMFIPEYLISIHMKTGEIIDMATVGDLINMEQNGDGLSYSIGDNSYFKNLYNNTK